MLYQSNITKYLLSGAIGIIIGGVFTLQFIPQEPTISVNDKMSLMKEIIGNDSIIANVDINSSSTVNFVSNSKNKFYMFGDNINTNTINNNTSTNANVTTVNGVTFSGINDQCQKNPVPVNTTP